MSNHSKKESRKTPNPRQPESDSQVNEAASLQFVDNRPEAVIQGKLQSMANQYTANLHSPIQKKENPETDEKKNNTGLPDTLKSGIENLSGHSMDDVKVHYNSDKPAQLNAHAYAQGSEIHLASGQEKHLPHEAWHVVQQKQGRVKPTMQMKGKVNVNDDKDLEKEADVMGAKAVQMKRKNDSSFGPGLVTQLWHKVKGQAGEFEGDESNHHLHDVGGVEHYKFGNDKSTRVNYARGGVGNYDGIQRAIASCESSGDNDSGRAACLSYLRQLLAETPEPELVETEQETTTTTSSSGGGSTSKKKGKGPKKKDKYANFKPSKDAFDFDDSDDDGSGSASSSSEGFM